MRRRLTTGAALCVLILAGPVGCDGNPAAVNDVPAPQFASAGPTLVECPSNVTVTAEGMVGSQGGAVALGRHRIQLPVQAVQEPHSIRLTDPATKYMVLDLKANGQDAFGFGRPVSITIDYSRCNRSNIDRGPLSVWKIDLRTNALLKQMGGIDDKVARTVTFTTDSLSGYSIAN
jgi:hypothetical protein